MRNTVNQCTSLTLLLAVSAVSALAQYGGGMGGGTSSTPGVYTAPKGGYGGPSGAAIGAGVGAAAVGAGLAFWALHKRPDLVGCVQHRDDGNVLMNEKDGRVYNLQPDSSLTVKPGERVALKGRKSEDNGKYSFQAHRLVKDYGACEAGPATAKNGAGASPSTLQASSK
jgi:hypothetical protein